MRTLGIDARFLKSMKNNDKAEKAMNELLGCKNATLECSNIILNEHNSNYNQFDTDATITELAESIKSLGLLHDLVVVRIEGERNKYKMLSGEKRFKAISKVLGWKKVPCKVFEPISKVSEELVINAANLEQRNLSDDQRFKGLLSMERAYEECTDEKERERFRKYIDFKKKELSSYKKRKYNEIKANARSEDIESFLNEELTLKELSEAASYQKKINKAQQHLQKAIKTYAQAQAEPELRCYINRSESLSYRVYETEDEDNKAYCVKEDNYSDSAEPILLITPELPKCTNKSEMQIFLDNYAVVHNLEECTLSELSELVSKQLKGNKLLQEKKSENKNEDFTDSKSEDIENTSEPQSSNLPDDDNEDDFIVAFEDDSPEVESSNEHSVSEEEEEPNETSSKEAIVEKEAEDTDENSNGEIEETIRNEYALNAKYEAEEKSTRNKVIGRLLIEKKSNRFFIVPDSSKVINQTAEDNGMLKYTLASFAYEVEPETINIIY